MTTLLRTPELIEKVRQSTIDHPNLSIKDRSALFGIGKTTMQVLLTKDLGYKRVSFLNSIGIHNLKIILYIFTAY